MAKVKKKSTKRKQKAESPQVPKKQPKKTSFDGTFIVKTLLILFCIFFVGALLYFSRSLLQLNAQLHKKSPEQNTVAQKQSTGTGLPVRLKIPKINVDADIEKVGLTSGGAMDAPKSPDVTGWYSEGARPGESGSAVIDGHLDWTGGTAGVFYHLRDLSKGDKLYVENDKGVSITFVVQDVRSFDPGADASEVFNKKDGTHLNLITCDGVWNEAKKSYTKRMVIFADAAS